MVEYSRCCGEGPTDYCSAVALDGLSVFHKGGTCFTLGSLGAREGDDLLLFAAFGYSDVTGNTFALLAASANSFGSASDWSAWKF